MCAQENDNVVFAPHHTQIACRRVHEIWRCNRRRCNNIREHLIRNTECESISPAPSDRFGQCARTGLQPSVGWKCTLSLGEPLIIYPYWTQFTLKLTGSRLVSLAKLTSKLTIYDRSLIRSLRSFVHSLASFYSFRLFSGKR